jgi:PQQ-like domain
MQMQRQDLRNGKCMPLGSKLLTILLALSILCVCIPNVPRARAAGTYHVTLSTRNFGIQFLHAQADDLRDPGRAAFSLTNGATLWYGIEVQSQPTGLRPVAADPFSDIVSALLAQHGLLPPSDIIPLNPNGTFFETVHLVTSFSGPGQSMQLTLNPFNYSAAAFDILNLILQLLGESNLNVQVGLLTPGHVQEILNLIGSANDLVSLIGDFKNMLQAVPTSPLTVLGDAHTCVHDLLQLFANTGELKVLGKILVLMVRPAVPGIAEALASFASGLSTFLSTIKLAKFLADLALSLGSYLFQQGTFPTVTLQSISSVTPSPTSTSKPTPTLTPTLMPSPSPTPSLTPSPSPSPTSTLTPSPTPVPTLTVYVGSGDDSVYALNAMDGSLAWRYQTGGEVTSSPVVVSGSLYVGSDDGYVYALNANDSSLLWRYRTGGQVQSSPDVVNGAVYIGSTDNYVYALNASNGSLLWQYQTGGLVTSSPAVVNGIV